MPEMGTKLCGYKEMWYEIVRDDIRIPEVLANLRRSHSIFTAVLVCLELLEPFGQVLPWQTITWISLAHCRERLWKQGALIPRITSLQCTSLGSFDLFPIWFQNVRGFYVYWARRRFDNLPRKFWPTDARLPSQMQSPRKLQWSSAYLGMLELVLTGLTSTIDSNRNHWKVLCQLMPIACVSGWITWM